MYESHWGLKESPFRSQPDPKFFYQSPSHDEALARLEFLVENRQRFAMLLGEQGSGKSTVLQYFARQTQRAGHFPVVIGLLGLSGYEFLWSLALQLGLCPPEDLPTNALWRRIVDRIIEHRLQRMSTVLLLDDAAEANSEVFNLILRLFHADTSPDSRLTIVLACQERQLSRIDRRLLDLSQLRIELEAWSAEETVDFLRSTASKAGGNATLFDSQAAERLFDLSNGVPRYVKQLAEMSLVAGAGQKLKKIDAGTVEAAYEELCAVHLAE